MAVMIAGDLIEGGDGNFDPARARCDVSQDVDMRCGRLERTLRRLLPGGGR